MIWTLLAHWVHLFLSGLSILLSPPFVKSFLSVFHDFLFFFLPLSGRFPQAAGKSLFPKFRIDTRRGLWYKLYVRF